MPRAPAAGNSLRHEPRNPLRPRRPEWRRRMKSTGWRRRKSNQRFASHIGPSVGLMKKLNKRPAPTPKRLTTSAKCAREDPVIVSNDEQKPRGRPFECVHGQAECEIAGTKKQSVRIPQPDTWAKSLSYNLRNFRRGSASSDGDMS